MCKASMPPQHCGVVTHPSKRAFPTIKQVSYIVFVAQGPFVEYHVQIYDLAEADVIVVIDSDVF